MTLEYFAKAHDLPERWLSLRRECEALVSHFQYWYRSDMQNAARILAVEASDILHARLERQCRQLTDSSACPSNFR